MAKLGDFKTPTGASGNLFDISSWIGLIIGTVVLFITFGVGQRFAQGLNGKLGMDTNIEQPWQSPQPILGPSKPSRVIY